MTSRILGFGAAAGLLVGIPISAWIVTGNSGHDTTAMAITYLVMLVALGLIFVAVKRQRDEQGGVIRFWPAFALGLGISFVAGLFYVAAFEAACAITQYDFASSYAEAEIAAQRAAGASAQAIARTTEEMTRLKALFANPFFRLPMIFAEIFPVGILVSLISAALLRNPRFMAARRQDRPSTEARSSL
jgi:hypothetical protein